MASSIKKKSVIGSWAKSNLKFELAHRIGHGEGLKVYTGYTLIIIIQQNQTRGPIQASANILVISHE